MNFEDHHCPAFSIFDEKIFFDVLPYDKSGIDFKEKKCREPSA